MKKCFPIILTVVVALFVHVGCLEFPGMTEIPEWDTIPIHIRNMSTSSGVTLTLPHWVHGFEWVFGCSVSLDPSPHPGIPVDSSTTVQGPHTFQWSLRRTIDSVVVAWGQIHIDSEKWVLIEENNSEWTCTWSDSWWLWW